MSKKSEALANSPDLNVGFGASDAVPDKKVDIKHNGTVRIETEKIQLHDDLKNIFVIDPSDLEHIKKDMSLNGFHNCTPIVCIDIAGTIYVCDGHTRYRAAKELGLTHIYVIVKPWSLEDAIDYAINAQANRRNITDMELLRRIELVDKPKAQGSRTDLASKDAKLKQGKSSAQTAKLLGTSQATVERARAVNQDEIAKQEVKDGKSISAAAAGIKERKNAAQEETISTDYTPTSPEIIQQRKRKDQLKLRGDKLGKLEYLVEFKLTHYFAVKNDQGKFINYERTPSEKKRLKDIIEKLSNIAYGRLGKGKAALMPFTEPSSKPEPRISTSATDSSEGVLGNDDEDMEDDQEGEDND